VLDCEARPVNSALQDKGLLANATAGNVLRFLPPYIIGKDEVALAIDILDSVLALAPNTETNTES